MLRFTSLSLLNPNRTDIPPLIVQALVVADDFRIAISEDVAKQLGLSKLGEQEALEAESSVRCTVPLFGPLKVMSSGKEVFSAALICSSGVVIGQPLAQLLGLESLPAFEAPPPPVTIPQKILQVEHVLSAEQCEEIEAFCQNQKKDRATVNGGHLNLDARDVLRIRAREIKPKINELLAALIKQYIEPFYGVHVECWERPELLLYRDGGKYEEHIDGEKWINTENGGYWRRLLDRDLSILLYLSDGFTGGKLSFPKQNRKIEPKKGMLVAFPSGRNYPHKAEKVDTGERLLVATWATCFGTPRVRKDLAEKCIFMKNFT